MCTPAFPSWVIYIASSMHVARIVSLCKFTTFWSQYSTNLFQYSLWYVICLFYFYLCLLICLLHLQTFAIIQMSLWTLLHCQLSFILLFPFLGWLISFCNHNTYRQCMFDVCFGCMCSHCSAMHISDDGICFPMFKLVYLMLMMTAKQNTFDEVN